MSKMTRMRVPMPMYMSVAFLQGACVATRARYVAGANLAAAG